MMDENLKVQGVVNFYLFNTQSGKFRTFSVSNLVVNSGIELFSQRILGNTTETAQSILIANGTTSAAATDTTFEGTQSVKKDIRLFSLSTNNQMKFESIFLDNLSDTFSDLISEICLFGSNDTLIARTVLQPTDRFIKTSAEILNVSWNIKIG